MPDIRTAKDWSEITITSGPLGKDTKIVVDGRPLKGVTNIEAVFDIKDAVRITVHHFVEHIALATKGVVHHQVKLIGVGEDETLRGVIEADGSSLKEALLSLAAIVEEEPVH